MVITVVPNPGLAQNLAAKTTLVLFAGIVPRVLDEGPSRNPESVRRGANTQNRTAAIEVVHHVLHLFGGKVLKAKTND